MRKFWGWFLLILFGGGFWGGILLGYSVGTELAYLAFAGFGLYLILSGKRKAQKAAAANASSEASPEADRAGQQNPQAAPQKIYVKCPACEAAAWFSPGQPAVCEYCGTPVAQTPGKRKTRDQSDKKESGVTKTEEEN